MSVIRVVLVLAMALAVPASSIAQQPDPDRSVQVIISRGADGYYSSGDEKDLSKLGDASGVALAKIFGQREMKVADIQQVLTIIMLSFGSPESIEREPDRRPQATLFVLKYLKEMKVPPDLAKKIDDTDRYLRTLPQKTSR